MESPIIIDPVTRIEGHAKVRIDLDKHDKIQFVGLMVKELRGFEKILTGMQVETMPLVTGRICGVCPVSHHLVAARALDRIYNVEPTKAGQMLREVMHLGGIIHSHTISLFFLSGPDIFMGLNSDYAKRNIVGIVETYPEISRKALELRTLGQKIVEFIGGRGVHPVTATTGGMTISINREERDRLKHYAQKALQNTLDLSPVVKDKLDEFITKYPGILESMEDRTYYMGTVKDGNLNLYEGKLRVINRNGETVKEFDSADYKRYIREETVDWSYMKPTYFVDDEKIEHTYRVNALARINVADAMETEKAQEELEIFRGKYSRPCHYTLMHLYARLIELVYACEKTVTLLADDAILEESRTVLSNSKPQSATAHIEAPRGVLVHDYEVGETGIVEKANLIVATQQNYSAINNTIKQCAEYFLNKSDNSLANSIEFFIRTYDPCLSCATHAVGSIPLEIKVFREGELLRIIRSNKNAQP